MQADKGKIGREGRGREERNKEEATADKKAIVNKVFIKTKCTNTLSQSHSAHIQREYARKWSSGESCTNNNNRKNYANEVFYRMWPVFEYVCSQTKHTAHQTRYCLRILKRCLFSRMASVAQPEHLGGLFSIFLLSLALTCSPACRGTCACVCISCLLQPVAISCNEKKAAAAHNNAHLMSVFGMWQEYIVHTLHTVSTQYSCNSIDKIVIVSKVERHVIEIFLAFFRLEIYYVRNVKAKGKIEIGFHRESNILQKNIPSKTMDWNICLANGR